VVDLLGPAPGGMGAGETRTVFTSGRTPENVLKGLGIPSGTQASSTLG
jgi:hypothetical protein